MTTLLMRMRAPMMSWGDHSRFTIRDTRREPTKSAVIGLLCAALGRPRLEPVDDLAALKMGVRIDREGVDLVGRIVGDLLDVHAAFGRDDEGHA